MIYSDFEPTDPIVANILAPYFENKIVYDMGAGDGRFAEAILASGAKSVVAVEGDIMLAVQCQAKGLQIINQDFMRIPIDTAQVLYCFTSFLGSYSLTQKIKREKWKGLVITQYYPLNEYYSHFYKPDEVVHAEYYDATLPFLIYKVSSQWHRSLIPSKTIKS